MTLATAIENDRADAEFSVFTHSAAITVSNPRTGKHRTFRVRTLRVDEDGTPWRVAQLLVGPCNDSHYRSFANVISSQFHGRNDHIVVWKKYRADSAFSFYAKMLANPALFAERYGLQFQAETSCAVCQRPLTDPVSIDRGIGPTCWKNTRGLR